MKDEFDSEFDPELEGYASLDRIGEVIENPKYLIYLDFNGSATYGANELPRRSVEDLAHYIMMREKQLSMVDSIAECMKLKPKLVIVEASTGEAISYDYLTIH